MSTKQTSAVLVGIIGILILLLAGSIGYILANENYKLKNDQKSEADNSKLLKEIEALKMLYESKIADKTNNYMSLQIQKDSIETLVLALENSKLNANALVKYKTEYKNLESKMKILVNEIVVLKSKKLKVIVKRDASEIASTEVKSNYEATSFKNEIATSKKVNNAVKPEVSINKNESSNSKLTTIKEEKVAEKQEAIIKKLDKNAKISLSDVSVTAYSSKSAAKKVPTEISSKTDYIKISFTIDANPNFGVGEKTYYFQILSSKNNVMGKRITEYFDNESLTYSFSKSFSYDGQNTQVSQEFLNSGFEKGYYFVNIFDRDKLVGKTNILLK